MTTKKLTHRNAARRKPKRVSPQPAADAEATDAALRKTRADGKSDPASRTVAGRDDFGSWFAIQAGRLSKHFELEI
jgi:hypothetical protein